MKGPTTKMNSNTPWTIQNDDTTRPGLHLVYLPNFVKDTQSLQQHLQTLEYVPQVGVPFKSAYATKNTPNYYRWIAIEQTDDWIYNFGGSHRNGLKSYAWTEPLITLRTQIEDYIGKEHGYYNAVLLNYYPDGSAALSAHHDNDAWLAFDDDQDNEVIVASISLGQARNFVLNWHQETNDLKKKRNN